MGSIVPPYTTHPHSAIMDMSKIKDRLLQKLRDERVKHFSFVTMLDFMA